MNRELELVTRHQGNSNLRSTIEIDSKENLLILANDDENGIVRIINEQGEDMYISGNHDYEICVQHRFIGKRQLIVLNNAATFFHFEYDFENKMAKVLRVVKINVDSKYSYERLECFCFDLKFERVYCNIVGLGEAEHDNHLTKRIVAASMKSGKVIKEFDFSNEVNVAIEKLEILEYRNFGERVIVGVNVDIYANMLFFREVGDDGEFKEIEGSRIESDIHFPKKVVNFNQCLIISSFEGSFSLLFFENLVKSYWKNKFCSLKLIN